jgi:hypothetical protein
LARESEAQEQWAIAKQHMDPLDLAFVEWAEHDEEISKLDPWVGLQIFRAAVEKCRLFGWRVPSPEEVRRNGIRAFRGNLGPRAEAESVATSSG